MLRHSAALGALLLSLAALAACRSAGISDGFITAPRGIQERSSDAGPELEAAGPSQPVPPGAGTAKAADRGKDKPAAVAAGVAPFDSAASSGPARSGAPGPAREPGRGEPRSAGADGKSFESARSSDTAHGAAGGAAREEDHKHPAPAGPEGADPAEGTRGREARTKKPEVPVQDLTRRPFRLRAGPPTGGVPSAAPPPAGSSSGVAEIPQALDTSPPPLTQLDVDMSDGLELETMLVGAYLIQISTSPDFARLRFSKVYDFMDEAPDVFGDIAVLELRRGYYWVRYAFLDLMGGQHPYSRPRAYYYRPPEKKKS
jgi:hypothetical protein